MRDSILARHYQNGLPLRISIENGHYQSFEPLSGPATSSLPWIAPGLIDPQINGFGGIDFNRMISSGLERADGSLAAQGCTHYLLTLITRPLDQYEPLFSHWDQQSQGQDLGFLGYHLEGPFLNPDPGYRGVHRPEHMTLPSLSTLQAFQSRTQNPIRLLTLAPEIGWPDSLNFLRTAAASGLRLSAGHSSLMGPELEASISAGLSSWTHLGNAAPANAHKFENVILHALASSLPYISLIPDGIHLPPHAFRALARALGSRLLLTTDAMAGAAAPSGDYSLGQLGVRVDSEGRATLPGTEKLAGSTLTPFLGVFRAASMSQLPWSDCWDAFSIRTAAWLGFRHQLHEHYPASFCLFDTDPKPILHQTWRRGVRVFNAL